MSAVAAIAPCFHCGQPAAQPVQARLDGAWRAFCCVGCAAAAEWIRDASLDDYYRLRTEAAPRVDPDATDLALWDREDLLQEHAHAVAGGRGITVLADGMRCAACAWLIDRALQRETGVLEASANAVTGRVRIHWDPREARLSQVLSRLAELGYRPYLAGGEARERAARIERNRGLMRLGVAGLGSMQAMMLSEALYLDFAGSMPLATRDVLRWLTFALSTPVVFYAGWPFLEGAWRELRQWRPGTDALIAASTLLAFFGSLWETLRGGPHVWFDAAVMFVFLLLAARMLEQRARRVAGAQVDVLARARPAFVVREGPAGARETVPLAALAVGDVVRVAAGEAVPADGVLLDEDAAFGEALLTGESRPVPRRPGDAVFASAVCAQQPVRIRVTAVGAQTRLSQLTRLVEQAQSLRPQSVQAADRVGRYFVLGLAAFSVLVYAAWRMYDPSRAFEVLLALLVISCPCALTLSVPTALAVAHGTLARLGVLVTRANALDALARVTDVVFDKTGTLGVPQPVLVAAEDRTGLGRDRALGIATALEADSRHPVALALAHAGLQGEAAAPRVRHLRVVTGSGVEGEVDGRYWRLGRAGYAMHGEDDGRVWLGDGREGHMAFELREGERHDARETLQSLREAGLDLHLVSGDAPAAVQRFAARVGIGDAHARQSPEDKLGRVRALQAEGRVVAMVGDGLNDAPVLAGADVSLALADGAPLAQCSADLVLAGSALNRIPVAMALARRTRQVIRQNLGWAIGYNLLALPLAAMGLVTPWLAALGMALSSLSVTLNALRLRKVSA